MTTWKQRILALCLGLCLLPVGALSEALPTAPAAEAAPGEALATQAEAPIQESTEEQPIPEWPVDNSDVTRSDFTLSLSLNASAFPADGLTDYQGWEELFKKLSLSGRVDTQRFPLQNDRVYFEGALNLKDRSVIPFSYEGYHSYRYIRSPAINNQSIHFQMNNFFEFMLKPYYFMDLPTQYLALLMYPEATAFLADAYEEPLSECFYGTGNRTVPYTDLYELCETLDAIAADDLDYNHVYFYVTCLLTDLQVSDATFDRLCYLEDYLDYLDPTQQGMTITVNGETETYVLGQTTLFTRTMKEDEQSFELTMPDEEGYLLSLIYRYNQGENGGKADIRLRVTAEEETRIDLHLEADGLPREEDTQAIGSVRYTVGGSAFGGVEIPYAFDFRLTRSAAVAPYQVTFGLDWLHPVTNQAAISLLYKGEVKMLSETVLQDRVYDNQNDFFHLNESFLEEYEKAFTLPLTLAFTPILLEMPAGVLNDILRFCDQSGILASLGIE